MTTNRLLSVMLVAALMCVAAPASADTPSEIEANARFEEGTRLWRAGKYEEARVKLVQAYAVLKKPGVLYNLALAEMTLGHSDEAFRLIREFLKMPQTDMDRSLEARKYLSELRKKVSLISLSERTPKGTRVMVDGVEAGVAPLSDPIVVKPGKHEIVLRYGADEKKETPDCAASETVAVELLPKEEPKGPGGPVTGPAPYTTEHGNWVPTVVLGVAGVAGLGIGGVLGALSTSHDDELRSLSTRPCRESDPACKLESEASAARGLGAGSMIGYIGGGVFLGAAIVTAAVMKPWQVRVRETRVQFVPGLGGGALVGTF